MPCKSSQVSYSLNGGAGGPVSKSYAHLSSVSLTPQPTRTGYTFQGWATTNGGSVVYNTSTTKFIMPNTAVNLYAVWTANTNTKYVVQHYQMDANGNYPSSPNETETKYGTSDSGLTLANLQKSYAQLPYSYGTADGAQTATTTIAPNGSRVIRLYYSRNRYTLSLGTASGISTSGGGTYYYQQWVTVNASVNTAGWNWNGWTSSNTGLVANSGNASYGFSMPASNMTLYPNSYLTSYTVSYNANGGNYTPPAQTKWYGQNLTLAANAGSKTGYTFQGWSASIGGTYGGSGTYVANSHCTMTAIWKSNAKYLIQNGQDIQSITGGWSDAPGNTFKNYAGFLSWTGSSMQFGDNDSANYGNYMPCTNSLIDFSGFSKLVVDFDIPVVHTTTPDTPWLYVSVGTDNPRKLHG